MPPPFSFINPLVQIRGRVPPIPSTQFSVEKKSFVVFLAGALILASILGLLIALLSYSVDNIIVVATIPVVLIIGPLLIIYPRIGLWVTIIGSLVFSGLIDLYLPSLKPLKWGLALLSMALGVVAVGSFQLGMVGRANKAEAPALVTWLIVFFVCAIFSSLVNWHGFAVSSVGLKGYFQVWGIFIAIYYLINNEKDAGRLIRFLLLLGLIQLPFVLHQFFILVPKRGGMLAAMQGVQAVDVVAGTFGGEMMGGGRSSSLALLLVICLTIVLARWRAGLVGSARALFLGFILLLPLLLNEAKIIVVLMPIALFLLFHKQILLHPVKSIVSIGALGLLMAAIFSVYVMLPGEKGSMEHMYEDSISYNFGNKGYGGLVLNRTTVYPFWFKEQMHGDSGVAGMLIGHGPGATNSGTTLKVDTLATKRYPGFGIGLTGISALLWEVGMLGTAGALAILYSAYRLSGRLVKCWEGSAHWPLLKATQIAVVLFSINLVHNNYFVEDLSFQALLRVILGYLLVMSRIERVQI